MIGGRDRSIMRTPDGKGACILDQRKLPWAVEWVELRSADDAARAIKEMWTRGAPMIGATGAYGLAMALADDPSDASLDAAYAALVTYPPDRDESALGARSVADAVRPLPARARGEPPSPAPTRFATRMTRSTARSASMGSNCSANFMRNTPTGRSTY